MISMTMPGHHSPENTNLLQDPGFREPAFGLEDSREVRLRDWPPASAKKFLAHAIVRKPRHLLHHTQRIGLAIVGSDRNEVFSALLDLNIALGPHGKRLRDRMRRAAHALLTSEQSVFLARVQITGCNANDRHPAAPYSVLSRGLTGKLDLVSRSVETSTQTSDPLDEADAQLMDGNVTAARTTLEHALGNTPERDDIASALLEIYVRSHDLASLRLMRARVGAPLQSRHDWITAEDRLSQARRS